MDAGILSETPDLYYISKRLVLISVLFIVSFSFFSRLFTLVVYVSVINTVFFYIICPKFISSTQLLLNCLKNKEKNKKVEIKIK